LRPSFAVRVGPKEAAIAVAVNLLRVIYDMPIHGSTLTAVRIMEPVGRACRK
jgi:hypothetical protein